MPSLLYRVHHVVAMVSYEEMLRVNAGREVAGMTDVHVLIERSMYGRVDQSRSGPSHPSPRCLGVPQRVEALQPSPAASLCQLNVCPNLSHNARVVSAHV